MNRTIPFLAFCLLFLFVPSRLNAQQQEVDFNKSIKPLFDKYCVSCHGSEKTESFRIDVQDDAKDFIEAGDPDTSPLYESLVTDDENSLMPPPDENNPMKKEEIELIKLWIEQGAKWPTSVSKSEPVVPPTSEQKKMPQDDKNKKADGAEVSEDKKNDTPAAAPAKQDAAGGMDPRIFRATGSLHPAVIHLPIGLLLAAGLFAFLSLRGNFVMSDCAYYCLWLGALGCIVACLTGWYAAPMKFSKEGITQFSDLMNQEHKVFWHRTGGLVLTVAALFIAMFAMSARNRDPDDGMLWKLCVMLLACGVGWVGNTGGKLTYGKYHYKDLSELASEWLPQVFGEKEEVPAAENKDAKPDEKKPADAGSTSGET